MTPTLPVPESAWIAVQSGLLAQGDYLCDCLTLELLENYGLDGDTIDVQTRRLDLIILTHSCDLENNKVSCVALCPILTISMLTTTDEKFGKPATLEEIRRGSYEALYMLSSPTNPHDTMDVRIVDFREIFSLPVGYLNQHAEQQGPRWRLKSPYLEHFSQGFARFFMRVGLPSTIPPFKK